jgi:hypothetical protein
VVSPLGRARPGPPPVPVAGCWSKNLLSPWGDGLFLCGFVLSKWDARGHVKKKSDVSEGVSAFFGGCEIFPAISFYRVFELPLLRNAQKRDKKNERNNPGKKKRRKKTPHFL